MLIEFTFENFKCYKNITTFQMEADALSENKQSIIKSDAGDTLPVAVIYGPNGGGKSSVLQALECLCDYVTWPYYVLRQRISGKVPAITCNPYAFDDSAKDEPTVFRAIFFTKGHTCRYVLAVKKGKVVEEYLHRRKPGKGSTATLFERDSEGIVLGPSLKRKRVSTEIDASMPYLSYLAINHDFEQADSAFEWFLDCEFLDYSRLSVENMFIEPVGDSEKERVIDVLNNMGADIVDIRFQHNEDEGLYDSIWLKHTAGGRELELSEESNGTKKLLSLMPVVLDALKNGTVVVSDELDAKLHPKLLRYVIRLFTDKRTNLHGAQLIFTSHDMTTLNSDIFRRDEIWFAARTEEGPSSLYSLADIVDIDGKRIRPQNAYDRQYLAGRYGADPYLKSMLDWGGAHE